MSDRQPIRDRVLILRVLLPGLEARLRDKMKEVEDSVPTRASGSSSPIPSGRGGSSFLSPSSSGNSGSSSDSKGSLLDLDGVTCAPTADGSNL